MDGDKPFIDHELISSGAISNFTNIYEEQMNDKNVTVVHIAANVPSKVSLMSPFFDWVLLVDAVYIFLRVLEFWYTGITNIADKSDFIGETKEAANLYECDRLVDICDNVLNDMAELNPSIGR